jgi:translation initiation factor IF-2
MLHASTQKLIQKLYELTESGDIAWKESREGRCILDTEGYRVEINEEPPLLRLLGADGRELEKAEAADLSATPWPAGDGTFASRVSDMSRRAQRVARGAEQAISKILSSLSAPPQKESEPEPIPAAIEFEPQFVRKAGPVSAAESPASLAALGADLATQRRASPPQLPHAAPAAAPEPPAAQLEADTAVSAALAVEASAPEVEPPVAAAEEELPLEDMPAPPKPAAPAVTSFAGPPTPPPATVTPNLFVTGFSAASRPPAPTPQAPQQAAQPAPPTPPQAEPHKPPRTGADLYKPWS